MVVEEYKENEEEFMYMKIRKKDICEFLSYNDRIKKRLTENKNVPIKFYDKMMSFIVPKDIDKQEYYNNIVAELTKDAVTYFKKQRDKRYYFKVDSIAINEDIPEKDKHGKRIIKNTTSKVTYTFEGMFENAMMVSLRLFLENKTKNDFLHELYLAITGYAFQDKKIKNKVNHFKATVFAGYITMKFGKHKELCAFDSVPTNQEIYNLCYYCTDPISPYAKTKKRK